MQERRPLGKRFVATIDCPECRAAWQLFHKRFALQRKQTAKALKEERHIYDHEKYEGTDAQKTQGVGGH